MTDNEKALDLFREISNNFPVIWAISDNKIGTEDGMIYKWDIVDLECDNIYGEDESAYLISSSQSLLSAVEAAYRIARRMQ